MQPPRPQESKAEWRAWASAAARRGAGDSAALTAALGKFLHARNVRRVLAYSALPGEPDVSALGTSFELFTTRTRFRPARRLTVHPWTSATERSRSGYWQPPADAPEVALAHMDAVLLPGLAFDRRGVRLGYGGGFYDRLLPGYAGLTVGVVWSGLVVPALPSEAHDCPVGWLATESGVQATTPAAYDPSGQDSTGR